MNVLSASVAVLLLHTAALPFGKSRDSRHVSLEGQPNFRDIGGYTTTDGRTVRRGLVYRSGELPRLTDDDVATLARLQIKTVVNFLTAGEQQSRGSDRLPRGTREISQPIDSEGGLAAVVEEARETADFSKLPEDISPELHRMLVDDGKEQFAELLKEIAATDRPLVFHCSHGVHRTGTAAAILLWGLGVPWESVRQDYLLSNKYRKSEVEKRLAALRDRAAKTQRVPPEDVDMSNARAFYILQGSYIDATRDEILRRYGSIEKYLFNGLGLSRRDVQRLRERLLEEPS